MHDFVRFDYDEVREEAIKRFEQTSGITLYNGDERLILIDTFMYIASILAINSDFDANQQLKATAVSPYLEQLGNDENMPIMEATQAVTSVKFETSMTYAYDVEIPKGTRITPNGETFFQTNYTDYIPAGSTMVTIPCTAVDPGVSGNGWKIGNINILVDVIPEITLVSNTVESSEGTDREDIEDYRERLINGQSAYSTAGPEESYKYYAKSADNSVGDVNVNNAGSGQVDVIVYGKNGSVLGDDVMSKISEALSAKTIRPLTDNVTVKNPELIGYSVDVSYTISNDVIDLESAKNNVEQSVRDYILYQSEVMGRNIVPDKLRLYMLSAGAETVTINAPSYTKVSDGQVAKLNGDPVITYMDGDA